ncbi:putative 50S ribosomal protein L22, chloroplastic-like [Capsicum annuum]|nr:putative 50S ribosomal protein L22, chloroplastic-like [Capsicum annuum]
MALVSGGRSILDPNAPLFIPSYDEEICDDDFGFAGNDVADLLPENIDLDVDEDIVNMEAQFEKKIQSSISEEQGIKSSLSGVNVAEKNGSQHGHFTIEEKLDAIYNGVRGCKEQIEKIREGVFCYGLPGTGKTFLARAVANHIDAYFIRVIGRARISVLFPTIQQIPHFWITRDVVVSVAR